MWHGIKWLLGYASFDCPLWRVLCKQGFSRYTLVKTNGDKICVFYWCMFPSLFIRKIDIAQVKMN